MKMKQALSSLSLGGKNASNTPTSSPSMRRGTKNTDPVALWKEINEGVEGIYRKQSMTKQRYMELHSHVYDFCTQQQTFTNGANEPKSKMLKKFTGSSATAAAAKNKFRPGAELYEKIRTFLTRRVDELRGRGQGLLDESALQFYTEQWEEFKFSSKVLNGICAYLNRHWAAKEMAAGSRDVYEVYTLALVTWRDTLFEMMETKVSYSILEMVNRERRRETINQTLVSRVLDNYVQLGTTLDGNDLTIYQKHFERHFLAETEVFYTAESAGFVQNNSVVEYMKYVENRLCEEEKRVHVYLHESTKPALTRTCESVLVAAYIETLQAEFRNLLKDDRTEDVARMYALVSRVPDALQQFADVLEDFVTVTATGVIERCCETAASDPRVFIYFCPY